MQDITDITTSDENRPEQQQDANAQQQPTAPETQAERIPSLEQQLRQAELAAQEHHDAWLRAKAEADNIRKRAQNEIASAHKFAVENFASELLAVKDSLEAALATDVAAAESLKSGVELTLKQLNSVFAKFSVSEINPMGERFDPHRHQAISAVESELEPNTVAQVLQKGYLLHERVIRPALVTVSKQKDQAVES
ncbi:MAG TPA: nucleotide exchange factor GrpE [Burkholderiales bacterium]|nr:nucleotide exchange factor GrpE [Burkholderiales bacterium]